MQVFTHQLSITDLKKQDLNEPYAIVYTTGFGIPAADFTRYVESLGGMANIGVAPNVSFDEKFCILKEYMKNGENIFSSSLNRTIRNLIKLHKGANDDEIEDELFDFADLIKAKAKVLVELESSVFSAKSGDALIAYTITRAGRLSGFDAPTEASLFMEKASSGELPLEQAKNLLIAFSRLKSKNEETDNSSDGKSIENEEMTEDYSNI